MKHIDCRKVALACMLLLSQMPVGMAAGVEEEDAIAAMGATDLDDVIRGIYRQLAPQPLLLKNSVAMTSLQQGNRGSFWGNYPVDNIARIDATDRAT